MKVIDIQNCNIFLESRHVLHDFSLEVEELRHLAIVGPNGSGKSTLIRLLTRDIYPSRLPNQKPQIKILGRDDWNIFEMRHEVIAISLKLSESILEASPLSVFDAVASAFFGTYGFFSDDKITQKQIVATEEILQKLHLTEIKNQLIHQLSCGQLRKVLIARAMVLKPKILLLDEPTSGLDIAAQNEFLQFLKKVLNDTTIILVTHHLEEILPEITQILLLKEGRVFAFGKKEEILNEQNLSELFETKIKIRVSKDQTYSMNKD